MITIKLTYNQFLILNEKIKHGFDLKNVSLQPPEYKEYNKYALYDADSDVILYSDGYYDTRTASYKKGPTTRTPATITGPSEQINWILLQL